MDILADPERLAELDGAGSPMAAAPDGAFPPVPEPHPSRAITAAGIAMMVLLANIGSSFLSDGTRPKRSQKARPLSER